MGELHQRKVMHARLQGGALYGYEILDGEKVVGTYSCRINKKTRPWTETKSYLLGDEEFDNKAAFIAAYRKQTETI